MTQPGSSVTDAWRDVAIQDELANPGHKPGLSGPVLNRVLKNCKVKQQQKDMLSCCAFRMHTNNRFKRSNRSRAVCPDADYTDLRDGCRTCANRSQVRTEESQAHELFPGQKQVQ